MNPIIEQIYATGRVTDAAGNELKVHSQITPPEGAFLTNLIEGDATIRKTLEVGCAYGISSLFICSAIAGRDGAAHTIIDPFQEDHWKNIGLENLHRGGFNFYKLIAEGSQFALPRLAQDEPGTYDFVFIDGWHTFDHTLIDVFYANLLLKVGGYIVVDDIDFAGVRKAVSYLSKYPAYKVAAECPAVHSPKGTLIANVFKWIPRFLWPPSKRENIYNLMAPSMTALQKVAEDTRYFGWYKDF